MKKTTRILLVLLLAVIVALSISACSNTAQTTIQDINAESQSQQTSENAAEKSGLWENATYFEDTEFGQGSNDVVVEVTADNQTVKFTVHTDEKTVGAALIENELIAGDESEYGLYVKVVNGMTADYDIDQSYWAFYIDGEYASTGVDSTDITEGAVYQLVYTK